MTGERTISFSLLCKISYICNAGCNHWYLRITEMVVIKGHLLARLARIFLLKKKKGAKQQNNQNFKAYIQTGTFQKNYGN